MFFKKFFIKFVTTSKFSLLKKSIASKRKSIIAINHISYASRKRKFSQLSKNY